MLLDVRCASHTSWCHRSCLLLMTWHETDKFHILHSSPSAQNLWCYLQNGKIKKLKNWSGIFFIFFYIFRRKSCRGGRWEQKLPFHSYESSNHKVQNVHFVIWREKLRLVGDFSISRHFCTTDFFSSNHNNIFYVFRRKRCRRSWWEQKLPV